MMTETTANYDEPWKEAIGTYFPDFMLFFYPEIYPEINWTQTPISLDKELEQITASAESDKRYADKLFKVWLLDNQEIWLLIHVEVQSQYDKTFAQRIYIYNYRAFDLYHKPVISLAILGDERNSWRPNYYQYGLGSSQLRLEFSIVKLLDYQWQDLEEKRNFLFMLSMNISKMIPNLRSMKLLKCKSFTILTFAAFTASIFLIANPALAEETPTGGFNPQQCLHNSRRASNHIGNENSPKIFR